MKKVLTALVVMLCVLLLAGGAMAERTCPACGGNDFRWTPVYDGERDCHWLICNTCSKRVVDDYCTPRAGSATCLTKEICSVCNCELWTGKTNPDNHYQVHTIPAIPATCMSDGWTEEKQCSGCGKTLVEQEVIPATGHTVVVDAAVPATCTETGVTEGSHCSECGEVFVAQQITPALLHWYGEWTGNGDGTHSADCQRDGCAHVGHVDCTAYEVNATAGEAEDIRTVCPVCGEYADTAFDMVAAATVSAVEKSLPRGEAVVRGMKAPFDGALYAFTVVHEYSGKAQAYKGAVAVTLPLDAQAAEAKLVRVDVAPATEGTARAEVWTEIAYTCENGTLTFETDAAGLYLLTAE